MTNTFEKIVPVKKTWQTPTIEVLAEGYVNTGLTAGVHEASFTPGGALPTVALHFGTWLGGLKSVYYS